MPSMVLLPQTPTLQIVESDIGVTRKVSRDGGTTIAKTQLRLAMGNQ
jgi:hypothetical protein